jgi:hypothetical protein
MRSLMCFSCDDKTHNNTEHQPPPPPPPPDAPSLGKETTDRGKNELTVKPKAKRLGLGQPVAVDPVPRQLSQLGSLARSQRGLERV